MRWLVTNCRHVLLLVVCQANLEMISLIDVKENIHSLRCIQVLLAKLWDRLQYYGAIHLVGCYTLLYIYIYNYNYDTRTLLNSLIHNVTPSFSK